MKHAAAYLEAQFPSQGIVLDLAGLPVDANGPEWRLNDVGKRSVLAWRNIIIRSPDTLAATTSHIASLIKTHSPDHVRNAFHALKFLKKSESFVEADKTRTEIPSKFFSEIRLAVKQQSYLLHYIRHWYRDCLDIGCPSFSAEIAFELSEKVVGGNRKGQAVFSLDPEEGPLSDLEITGLLNALRGSAQANSLPLAERAALWLCVALGANPIQYALVREDDIEVADEGGQRFVQIRIPRMKKGADAPRAEFRTRKLTPEIGKVVLDLIGENRRKREVTAPPDDSRGRPLFVRDRLRSNDRTGPLAEYGWHLYAKEFTDLVGSAVLRLGVRSPRTGRALRVTTRRLRYTFATRLVREGASMRDLAEALDHTDLQNVRVYFDIKSDIVESLDKAMALALGPVAQAFLGKLVGGEAEAMRGDDSRSRIMVQDRTSGQIEGLGTCGQHSFCNLFAPVACYTCHLFQPWMDGPHDKILETLLSERERRATAGQDGRMVSLHDATILAIGDVITRIEAISGRAVA